MQEFIYLKMGFQLLNLKDSFKKHMHVFIIIFMWVIRYYIMGIVIKTTTAITISTAISIEINKI